MPKLTTTNQHKVYTLTLKDYITIGFSSAALLISTAAFLVSGVTAYFTTWRVTDDVRVVVGTPVILLPDFKAKQFEVDPRQTLIFINSGTRSVVINSIFLIINQPRTWTDLPQDGCNPNEGTFLTYDAEPFVVKSGEMAMKRILVTAASVSRNSAIYKNGKVLVAASDVNRSREKFLYKICLEVAFTTPGADYDAKAIDEFADEIGPDVGGYLFTREGTERPPRELINKSRMIFSHD